MGQIYICRIIQLAFKQCPEAEGKLLQFTESPERGIKEQKRDENLDPLVLSGLNQPASHDDINL